MSQTGSPRARRVETTRFGTLQVDEERIIEMPEGLIGFEDCRHFIVVQPEDSNALQWFQSLDDGSVAFPIVDPWQVRQDYAPTLSDADADALELTADTPKLVLTIVTIPRQDPRAMTVNLLGPLVINLLTRRGKQVVVMDDGYTTRHGILEEMRNRRED